jgi:acyl-CoA thioester hydrolase
MAFLTKNKIGLTQLNRWGVGPVMLHERFSFFKEIYADQTVFVGLEVAAISEDGSIFQFVHKFYLPDGTHCATAEATGVWIDIMLRKITTPPEDIGLVMNEFKTKDAKIITRDYLKTLPIRPEKVDASVFSTLK